ncbi:MAG: class I SAM-dependent methyltransferase [Alphaproteobacteria bacterium]|nr:class I SAM-dependent methyltransferase [Alphaproteobacteria bacterium]
MTDGYEFTNDWFAINAPVWRNIVADMKPRRFLEVGTFEGQSAVFMAEGCASAGGFEMTCIDTWAGGIEHNPAAMSAVEARFDRNMARAQAKHAFKLRKIKSESTLALAQLLAEGAADSFDVVYIDASHQAPDVLADAVLAFKLTRIGGVMIFDDYLWRMDGPGGDDILNAPKVGIDAFVNTYLRKLNVVTGPPIRQLYVAKTSN